MRRILRYSLTAFLLALACGVCMAQTDRKEVRAGNRQYKKGNWQNAEIEYRKAQAKDSTSFAAGYNLAGALYREGNFDEAAKTLDRLKEIAPASGRAADYFYNQGNVAVQKKDWKAAVEAYKQSILLNPEDLPNRCSRTRSSRVAEATTSRIRTIRIRTIIRTIAARIRIRIRMTIMIRIKETGLILNKILSKGREMLKSPLSRLSRC